MRREPALGDQVIPTGGSELLRVASVQRVPSRVVEPLCVDARDLAVLLGISPRHVRAMKARGALPEALRIGRRRLWRVEEIRAWVTAGMPPRDRWQWEGMDPS